MSMRCPKCNGINRVVDTITNRETNETYRMRKCLCGHVFYTVEFEVEVNQQFSETWAECQDQLRHSIDVKLDGWSDPEATDLTDI